MSESDVDRIHDLALSLFKDRDFRGSSVALEAIFALGLETPATLFLYAICASELKRPTLSQRMLERGRAALDRMPAGAPGRAAYTTFRDRATEWIERRTWSKRS